MSNNKQKKYHMILLVGQEKDKKLVQEVQALANENLRKRGSQDTLQSHFTFLSNFSLGNQMSAKVSQTSLICFLFTEGINDIYQFIEKFILKYLTQIKKAKDLQMVFMVKFYSHSFQTTQKDCQYRNRQINTLETSFQVQSVRNNIANLRKSKQGKEIKLSFHITNLEKQRNNKEIKLDYYLTQIFRSQEVYQKKDSKSQIYQLNDYLSQRTFVDIPVSSATDSFYGYQKLHKQQNGSRINEQRIHQGQPCCKCVLI